MTSQELAAFLDLLASDVRENGDALIAEIEMAHQRVEDDWHLGPATAGRAALAAASERLGLPATRLAALIRVYAILER